MFLGYRYKVSAYLVIWERVPSIPYLCLEPFFRPASINLQVVRLRESVLP